MKGGCEFKIRSLNSIISKKVILIALLFLVLVKRQTLVRPCICTGFSGVFVIHLCNEDPLLRDMAHLCKRDNSGKDEVTKLFHLIIKSLNLK